MVKKKTARNETKLIFFFVPCLTDEGPTAEAFELFLDLALVWLFDFGLLLLFPLLPLKALAALVSDPTNETNPGQKRRINRMEHVERLLPVGIVCLSIGERWPNPPRLGGLSSRLRSLANSGEVEGEGVGGGGDIGGVDGGVALNESGEVDPKPISGWA